MLIYVNQNVEAGAWVQPFFWKQIPQNPNFQSIELNKTLTTVNNFRPEKSQEDSNYENIPEFHGRFTLKTNFQERFTLWTNFPGKW